MEHLEPKMPMLDGISFFRGVGWAPVSAQREAESPVKRLLRMNSPQSPSNRRRAGLHCDSCLAHHAVWTAEAEGFALESCNIKATWVTRERFQSNMCCLVISKGLQVVAFGCRVFCIEQIDRCASVRPQDSFADLHRLMGPDYSDILHME